jgi:predicted nucleic acid-binding protein
MLRRYLSLSESKKIVFDTVTISNFINIGKLDLICEFYHENIYITESVIIELSEKFDISNWINTGKIKTAIFDYDDENISMQKELSESLGDGEISCIIYGLRNGCIIATDDGKARKIIKNTYRYSYFTGTIGILEDLIRNEYLTNQGARLLLEEMIEKGFWYKGDILF